MIYLIIDVHYKESQQAGEQTATVAGIRFTGIESNHILSKQNV